MSERVCTEIGDIDINNDVISAIAGHEVSRVAGVVAMAESAGVGILKKVSGRDFGARGIKVRIDETNRLFIDVSVIVEYGVFIPDVARNVQEAILSGLHRMTKADVAQINVHVAGIEPPKEENKQPTPERGEGEVLLSASDL